MSCRFPSASVAIGRWWLVAVTTVVGCYDPPRPACGFVCGPAGACPEDYRCNVTDGRCHRSDTPESMTCPSFTDAGSAPSDTPLDVTAGS